jgi:hypothetical protein
MVSSGGCFNRKSANLRAVFLPIPGNLEISFTASSTILDGYSMRYLYDSGFDASIGDALFHRT